MSCNGDFFRATFIPMLRAEGLPEELPNDARCYEVLSAVQQGLPLPHLLPPSHPPPHPPLQPLAVESVNTSVGSASNMVQFYMRESSPLSASDIATLKADEAARRGLRKWFEAGELDSMPEHAIQKGKDKDNYDDDDLEALCAGKNGGQRWRARYIGVSLAGVPFERLQRGLSEGQQPTRSSRIYRLLKLVSQTLQQGSYLLQSF